MGANDMRKHVREHGEAGEPRARRRRPVAGDNVPVTPSPTMTTVRRPCAAISASTAFAFPPEADVGSRGSNWERGEEGTQSRGGGGHR